MPTCVTPSLFNFTISNLLTNKIPVINSENDVKSITSKLYFFLDRIHYLGMAHLDFTDTNIYWDNLNNPKIVDYERAGFLIDNKYLKTIDIADMITVLYRYLENKYIEIEIFNSMFRYADEIKKLDDKIEGNDLSKDEKNFVVYCYKKIIEKLNNFLE